ncbi:MAG: hypothetical protein M0R76_08140 [Proteobacteria bacterium]|nr:hypothetical protein [Pseudomonadota bacterium]
MMRHSLSLLFCCLLWALPTAAQNDVSLPAGVAPLTSEDAAALDAMQGCSDPGAFHTLALQLPPEAFVAAYYGPNHAHRMTALYTARYLADPWPVLDYLAAFMNARHHRAAALAAESLLHALAHIDALRAQGTFEAVPGHIAQLHAEVLRTARNRDNSRDIRTMALRAAHLLGQWLHNPPSDAVSALLKSNDPLIRAQALRFFAVPLLPEQVSLVGRMALGDGDLLVRGLATGMLCENALAQQVDAPSADLANVMRALLEEADITPDAAAALFACLANFSHAARAALTDQIAAHPNPALQDFWRAMSTPQTP